jgi:flagellin-like hook-associated protein FlgL
LDLLVEGTKNSVKVSINLSSQENARVGVDPAKAATDLAQAQVADQATINATGRILSLPTLLDFLQPPP